MSKIIPELISISTVRIFKAILLASDEYLNNPVKPEGIEIKIGQNTALNVENKNVRIRLNVNILATKNEIEPIGLTAEYGLEFHIHVGNLEQFLVEKGDQTILDQKLGGTLNGIVLSTARGIIFERTSSTFFNGVLLPVIDPKLLVNG